MSHKPDEPGPETRRMNEEDTPKKEPARKARAPRKAPAKKTPAKKKAAEAEAAESATDEAAASEASTAEPREAPAPHDDESETGEPVADAAPRSDEAFDPEATVALTGDELDAQVSESIIAPSDRPSANDVTLDDGDDEGDGPATRLIIDTDEAALAAEGHGPETTPIASAMPETRHLDDAELEALASGATAEGEGEEPASGEEPAAAAAEHGDVAREHLKGLIEALIFASDKPLKALEVARAASAPVKEVRILLEVLRGEYAKRGIHLDEVAGGWVFRTSATYAPFVRDMSAQKPVRLTRAQVETLAILAYRQPITRPEIDEIRGVDCGPVLKLLLERDLVRILGKKDEPGRPLLYGTTPQFLEFFGLRSLRDLPTLREFTELNEDSRKVVEDELGEAPEPGATFGQAEAAPSNAEGGEAPVQTERSLGSASDVTASVGEEEGDQPVATDEDGTPDPDATLDLSAPEQPVRDDDAADDDAADDDDADK